MKTFANAAAVSLLALGAALEMPSAALAACTPSVTSASYTTCIGTDALSSNTSGDYDTAVGTLALHSNTSGSYNTAIGVAALGLNTFGSGNTALGFVGLGSITTGSSNTSVGSAALSKNEVGNSNTAIGDSSLEMSTGNENTGSGASTLYRNTGNRNTALGFKAGVDLTTGSDNIAIGNAGVAGESGAIRIGTPGSQTRAFVAGIRGVSLSGGQAVVVNANGQLGVAPAVPGTSNVAVGGAALGANTTGNFNTAAGSSALAFNTTGSGNTASGASSLGANTTGSNNTASGVNALKTNSTGSGNTASGASALKVNTTGSFNLAEGVSALTANTTGNQNVAVGYEAAKLQTTGSANTAVGFRAGMNWTVGSNNIAIASPGVAAEAKTIRIGVPGVQTRAFMSGIRGVNVTGGQAVVVNAAGQLGVVSSSLRYKQDVQPMGAASDPLMQLRPVTFRYKQAEADGSRPLQYGLIAEEVARAMPGLAIYNAEGQPESVAYQALPSLLLNEYQKQARELSSTRAELQAVEAELATMRLAMQKLASAR